MDRLTRSSLLPGILVTLLAAALIAWMAPDVFFHPNAHQFMIGGDGFIISYHLHYFTRFGSGIRLTDMNYPFGELIFMTDAQAILALALKAIRSVWPNVVLHVQGIQHGLLLYSAPLAALFLWLSLRRLAIPGWRAVVYALILFTLIPQINRMVSGHFGLGYLWVLPLILWWMLRLVQGDHRWRLTIVLTIVLILFGLNNPYLILICTSFLVCFLGLVILGRMSGFLHADIPVWPATLVAILPPSVVMGVVKGLDTIPDRVVEPWGFHIHVAQFESIFYPSSGPVHDWIHALTPIAQVSGEGIAYVGLSATLVMPFLLLGWWMRTFTSRGSTWAAITPDRSLNVLLWSSIPVLLFSCNILSSPWLAWIPEKLPVWYQFRAPGRFAWVFFFTYGLTAAWWIDHYLIGARSGRWVWWLRALAILLLAFWGYEGYTALRIQKDKPVYESRMSEAELATLREEALAHQITKDRYQAIYLLPVHTGWTDKLIQPDYFSSEYAGYRYSLATGIPLLTGKLSRISLSQAARSVQWASHPWIERPGFASLPDRRDLLLVMQKDATLSEGEAFLRSKARLLIDGEYHQVYALPADAALDEGIRQANQWITGPDGPRPYSITYDQGQLPIRRTFDEHKSDWSFSGQGAMAIEPGWDTLAFIPLTRHDALWVEASVWFALQPEHYGMPGLRILEKNPKGEVTVSEMTWSASSKDIVDGWVRCSMQFPLVWDCDTLFVFSEHIFPGLADDLLIREVSDTIYTPVPGQSDRFFLNNYPVPRMLPPGTPSPE